MPDMGLIAVTGGTGFVGRHVIRALLEAGYKVRALARTPSKLSDIDHLNLSICQGGLGSCDDEFVLDAQIVLHMAGLIKARTRDEIMATNRDATGALTNAAQAAGVSRFILLSSQTAAQPQLSDYAASKEAGEMVVKAEFKGALAIIRAPAVFGPGDQATKPFFEFIAKGKLPVVGGKDWQSRKMAMVYVKDLAHDITARAMQGDYDGQIVTPCSVSALTWPDFAQSAEQALGIPVKTQPIPVPIIKTIAAATSLTSRFFGIGHLTLGKLREFRYEDWSSQDVIQDATPFVAALRETAASYEKTSEKK